MNRRLRCPEGQKPLLIPEDSWLGLLVPTKLANSTNHQFPCLKGTLEKPQREIRVPETAAQLMKTCGEMESLIGWCFSGGWLEAANTG